MNHCLLWDYKHSVFTNFYQILDNLEILDDSVQEAWQLFFQNWKTEFRCGALRKYKPSSLEIQSSYVHQTVHTFCPLSPGAPSSPGRPFFPWRMKQSLFHWHVTLFLLCNKIYFFSLDRHCLRKTQGEKGNWAVVWMCVIYVLTDVRGVWQLKPQVGMRCLVHRARGHCLELHLDSVCQLLSTRNR